MSSTEASSYGFASTADKNATTAAPRANSFSDANSRLDELARQIVGLASILPGVLGARLWRLDDGASSLWQQSGKVPVAGFSPAAQATSGNSSMARPQGYWASSPTKHEEALAILEAFGGTGFELKTQAALERLANIAKEALSYASEEQRAHDLAEILEATKLLNSTLNLSELIDIILQLSTRLCEADRGTVFLVDRKHSQIWSLKGLGLERHEIRLPIERGIAGWVARHGEVVRVADASLDSRFDPTVDHDIGYHTCELLASPIRDKSGEIIGVLELLNKRSGPFSLADERCLDHLSTHLALALGNAQLHREILAKQRLENDLALARAVQQGLLPDRLPQLLGFDAAVAYKPSLMVGGDYYDFMLLKPQSLLAVVADVEGKGVASALTMANLHATLHSLATHVHALEHLVTSLNSLILRDTRTHTLLSMFVAVVDEKRKTLHYINAGHVPPVVIRDNSELCLDEGGMLLGALEGATYKRGRVELHPEDILAAYTDGITEAMNSRGEEFGFQRLVDLVRRSRSEPAARIVEIVLSEVDRHSADGPEGDDRVMLICKVG